MTYHSPKNGPKTGIKKGAKPDEIIK